MLYKKKADKVRPVDLDRPKPGLDPQDKQQFKHSRQDFPPLQETGISPDYSHYLSRRFNEKPCGFWLLKERVASLKIRETLLLRERELVKYILLNYKAVFRFEYSNLTRISPTIIAPLGIDTEPHIPQQAPPFKIPKALLGEVTKEI